MNLRVYWPSACPHFHFKERCSPSDYRRIRRWEHEHILEAMQRRLDRKPDAMTICRSTVEHIFGTLKQWMGATHFLTRTPGRLSTEMSLQVLAHHLEHVLNIPTWQSQRNGWMDGHGELNDCTAGQIRARP